MKYNSFILGSAFLAMAALGVSCQEDLETYDSKAYLGTSEAVSTILLEVGVDNYEQKLTASIPQPAERDLTVTFVADPSLADTYNAIYGDTAHALPADYYEIPEPSVLIKATAMNSSEVTVKFKNMTNLNTDYLYVLPVTMQSADIEVLGSKRTVYYLIKEGALVNSVLNLQKNNMRADFPNKGALNNLSKLTVEMLVNFDNFAEDRGSGISSLIGIEGKFLLRLGDSGVPNNQLQVASSNGNVSSSDWVFTKGKWTHLAVTYDNSTGKVEVYIDGVKKTDQTFESFRGQVDWGIYVENETEESRGFWIGYSYQDSRYLDGSISEVRVWDTVLSAGQIKAENHFYLVENPEQEEHLVAYWKCNEGSGSTVKDYSKSGNDLKINLEPKWVSVSLPEK